MKKGVGYVNPLVRVGVEIGRGSQPTLTQAIFDWPGVLDLFSNHRGRLTHTKKAPVETEAGNYPMRKLWNDNRLAVEAPVTAQTVWWMRYCAGE